MYRPERASSATTELVRDDPRRDLRCSLCRSRRNLRFRTADGIVTDERLAALLRLAAEYAEVDFKGADLSFSLPR